MIFKDLKKNLKFFPLKISFLGPFQGKNSKNAYFRAIFKENVNFFEPKAPPPPPLDQKIFFCAMVAYEYQII